MAEHLGRGASAPLPHTYPQWEIPEDDPTADEREVWRGEMRIVHAQRARKLRRRGVPLMDLRPKMREGCGTGQGAAAGYDGRAKYAWFVDRDQSRRIEIERHQKEYPPSRSAG